MSLLRFLSRRRSFAALVVAAGLLGLLAGCSGGVRTDGIAALASAPAPTLAAHTPTPSRPSIASAPTIVASPAASVAPTISAVTPAPSSPDQKNLFSGLLKQLGRRPIPTPVATPAIVHHGDRIDEIGPVAVATVAPLSPGSGLPPVRLQIPALDLDTTVRQMGWKVVDGINQWDVVDNAAGHHLNSAYPGEAGNVVVSGHNNIDGAVFGDVCVIGQPGVAFGLEDEMILVDSAGRSFTYQVNGWHRLEERNASIATRQDNAGYQQQTETAQLTLVTCWPPWSNTHRVVVTGVLVEMEEGR